MLKVNRRSGCEKLLKAAFFKSQWILISDYKNVRGFQAAPQQLLNPGGKIPLFHLMLQMIH